MKIPNWYKRSIIEAVSEIAEMYWVKGKNIPTVQLTIEQWQRSIKETAEMMGNYEDRRTRAGKWYQSMIEDKHSEIKKISMIETDFGMVEIEVI